VLNHFFFTNNVVCKNSEGRIPREFRHSSSQKFSLSRLQMQACDASLQRVKDPHKRWVSERSHRKELLLDRISDACSGDSANWKREARGSANARRALGRRGPREETFAAPESVLHQSRMRSRRGPKARKWKKESVFCATTQQPNERTCEGNLTPVLSPKSGWLTWEFRLPGGGSGGRRAERRGDPTRL